MKKKETQIKGKYSKVNLDEDLLDWVPFIFGWIMGACTGLLIATIIVC